MVDENRPQSEDLGKNHLLGNRRLGRRLAVSVFGKARSTSKPKWSGLIATIGLARRMSLVGTRPASLLGRRLKIPVSGFAAVRRGQPGSVSEG